MDEPQKPPNIKHPLPPEEGYTELNQRLRVQWLVESAVDSVLECGCMKGYIVATINHPDSCGVDFNKERIMIAKKKYPSIRFYVIDVSCGLPFEDNSFGTVILPDILEHMYFSQTMALLKDALRVCRKKVLITLPYAQNKDYNRGIVETDEHIWIPSDERLSWLLSGYNHTHKIEKEFIFIEVKK